MSHVDHSRTGSRNARGAVAALALALAAALAVPLPAGAQGGGDVRIEQPPTVAGTAQVGSTVTAEGARWRPSNATVTWRWYRCETSETPDGDDDGPEEGDCDAIAGANGTSYTVAPADEGQHLRVLLVVRRGNRWHWAISAASAEVAAAPAPPPPPPPPAIVEPTGGTAPLAAPPTATGGVQAETVTRPARLMRPVPLVRIRGRTTLRGARITLLTVTAPKGARITLACRGRGCPVRRWARTAATTRILRFERRLRAGTRLTIRVTKPGRIGKHTTILIRRNRAPLRSDRCLYPGRSRPVACPAA